MEKEGGDIMRKRFTILLTLLLVISLFLTGCGPNTQAYMDKAEEVSDWEAQESKYTGNFRFLAYDMETEQEIKFDMPFEVDMYIEGQDKGVIDYRYDLSGIKAIAPSEEEGAMFPDEITFKMYVDGNKAIISKDMFTMGIEGIELDILEGDEKYIALDMSEFGIPFVASGAEFKKPGEDIIALFEEVYGEYESGFDMKREGDKFSYEFDTEDGKTELTSFLELTKEHRDVLIKGLEPFIVSINPENAEEIVATIDEGLAGLNMEEVNQQIDQMMSMISGSKISGSIEFKDDSLTQNMNMVLNVTGAFKMEMTMSGYDKKVEAREIEIPTDVKVVKYSEYMESVFSSMEVPAEVPVEEKNVVVLFNDVPMEFDTPAIIEDGRTLVSYRAFLESLGAVVEWDEEAQMATATKGEDVIVLTIGSDIALVNGEEVQLDKAAKVVDDRTLVPLRFIAENFGFKVGFENTPMVYLVTVTTE